MPARPLRTASTHRWLLASLLVATGCSAGGVDDARQAWLVDRLTRENAIFLSRDSSLLAAKYERMAGHPYDWVRGSAGIWAADQARPGGTRVPTAFANDPITSQVLLAGDPHPENLGTFLPGEGPGPDEDDDVTAALRIELNDLDGAAWGPWVLDLRRAGLGVAMLAWGLEELGPTGCDEDCQEAAVRALAEGYAAAVSSELEPEPCTLASCTLGGLQEAPVRLVADLLDEAEEEGRERKRLEKYTTLDQGQQRALMLDEDLDELGEGILALSTEEQEQVERLVLALAADGPEGMRILDAARRFGAGVSSLPAVRYVLLYDRGDDGPDDDDLLNVREVFDPPVMPGLIGTMPGLFDSQADRAAMAPRLLWSTPDADAAHRGISEGAQTFKATSWSSWFQGFDREKIEEGWEDGDLEPADLEGLARVLGATLGAGHRRAPTAGQASPALALQDELDGRSAELEDELAAAAAADLAQALADHALLADALLRYGPLLGADTLETGVGR